jgi:hypothetical protein
MRARSRRRGARLGLKAEDPLSDARLELARSGCGTSDVLAQVDFFCIASLLSDSEGSGEDPSSVGSESDKGMAPGVGWRTPFGQLRAPGAGGPRRVNCGSRCSRGSGARVHTRGPDLRWSEREKGSCLHFLLPSFPPALAGYPAASLLRCSPASPGTGSRAAPRGGSCSLPPVRRPPPPALAPSQRRSLCQPLGAPSPKGRT